MAAVRKGARGAKALGRQAGFYEVQVEGTFSAAHRLRRYGTKCENLHGHNWTVVVIVRSSRLDQRGVCIDFRDLRHALATVLDELDHKDLNSIPPFDKINPSAENIARFIFDRMSPLVAGKTSLLWQVRVAESAGCWAAYGLASTPPEK